MLTADIMRTWRETYQTAAVSQHKDCRDNLKLTALTLAQAIIKDTIDSIELRTVLMEVSAATLEGRHFVDHTTMPDRADVLKKELTDLGYAVTKHNPEATLIVRIQVAW